MRVQEICIVFGIVILVGGCSSTDVPIGHSPLSHVEQRQRGDILFRNLADIRTPSPTLDVIGSERNVFGAEIKSHTSGKVAEDVRDCVVDVLKHLGYTVGDFSENTVNTNFNPTVMLKGHLDRFWTDLRLQTETDIGFGFSVLPINGGNVLWKASFAGHNKQVNINGGMSTIAESITNAMDKALAKALDSFASDSFQKAVLAPACMEYQGKNLSTLLKGLERWNGDTNNQAFVAFRAMGTNMIPTLLQILQPRKIKGSLFWGNTSDEGAWQRAAAWALYAMGSNASPAALVLTNLLFQGRCLNSSSTVLAGIGSEGIPLLLSASTNQSDEVQVSAVRALGWERSDLKVVVPALIERLEDHKPELRGEAVASLGRLRSHPELVLPALIKIYPQEITENRIAILRALSNFGPNATNAVPLIIPALQDEEQSVRRAAASALKEIAPDRSVEKGE